MVGKNSLPTPVAVSVCFDCLESGAHNGDRPSLPRTCVPLSSALSEPVGTYNNLGLFLGMGFSSLAFVGGFNSLALLGVGS